MSKILKTVFLGTPEFVIPTLSSLHKNQNIDLHSIVTMTDKPVGRGKHISSPAVAIYAKENNLNLIQTDNINNEEEVIKNFLNSEIDLIIVFAFAQFLKKHVLDIPKLGCFNIHTSLLPKYRGAAPIQHAILNGETETGITIQKMVKKMDAGDVALSKKIIIEPHFTTLELSNILMQESPKLLNTFIDNILNNSLNFTSQDENLVTFAPTLKKEDGLINFKHDSAHNIINRIKAFTPWPGTFCYLNSKRLKLYEAELFDKKLEPNEVNTELGCFLIGTANGTIRIKQLQLEGKRASSDADFLNGLREKITIN